MAIEGDDEDMEGKLAKETRSIPTILMS